MRLHGFTGLIALLGWALTSADAAAQGEDASRLRGEYVGAQGRRDYTLVLPGGRERPAPLVVLLHGCAQDAGALAAGTGFDARAEAAGVAVLYPEQPASANPKRCWNWFDPAHQSRGGGEPALIAGMTREIAGRYPVDPSRIYIGGLSAGGAMAVLTGLAYPDLFAAIGAHSGVGWRAAHDLPTALAAMAGARLPIDSLARLARQEMGPDARAVPLIALHGAADSVVRPLATQEMVAHLVALHGLLASGPSRLAEDTTRGTRGGYQHVTRRFRDGRGEVRVEEWLIDRLGHAWSGGSATVPWMDPRGPDATTEMLRFFLRQRLMQEAGSGQAER